MAAYHARRSRVLTRLAEMHPDEYADLIALERILEGLDPDPDWTPAKCGTRSGYVSHRRRGEDACRPCKDAQAKYARELRSRGLPDGDERHGTLAGRNTYGCRCDPCRAAKAAYSREYRRRTSA